MADETIETTDSINIDDVSDMPAKPVINSNVIKNTNFDSKTNYVNNNINNSQNDHNDFDGQFINNSFENVTNADVEINNPSEELSNDTALPNQEYNDFINNEQNANINITNKPSDNLGITNENISEQEPFGPGNNPIHTDTNSNDSIDDDFTPPIIGDMNNSDINEPTIGNSQEIPSDDSIDLDKINGENNIIDENTALKDEKPENIINTPDSDNIHITDDNKSNNFRNVIIGGLGAAAAGAIGITAMHNKEKGDRDEN